MPEPVLRRATVGDVDFLVEAAVAADKSGTERSSYAALFDLSPEEVSSTLREVLLEDIAGQELCVSDAWVAEVEGTPVASVTAWVEEHDGVSSSLAKSTVLFSVLGRERARAAKPRLALLSPLAFPRTKGVIQLESIYVVDVYRGRGLVGALVAAHLESLGPWASATRAEIILAGDNVAARRAYERLGFTLMSTRTSDDPAIDTILPCRSRILMGKTL